MTIISKNNSTNLSHPQSTNESRQVGLLLFSILCNSLQMTCLIDYYRLNYQQGNIFIFSSSINSIMLEFNYHERKECYGG